MAVRIITIPIAPSVPHQTMTITLDGRRYEMRLDWIQRVRRWAMSVATDTGESLLRCKFLALRSDLLRQIRYNPSAPQGILTVVDQENQDAEASLDTLGTGKRHALIYIEGLIDTPGRQVAAAGPS